MVTEGSAWTEQRVREVDTNFCVLLPGNKTGQSGFLSLGSSNGGDVEQISRALFGLFLSGELIGVLGLLLSNGWTEFVRYPIERIVKRDSERWKVSANDLRRTGIHVPPPRNPLYVR